MEDGEDKSKKLWGQCAGGLAWRGKEREGGATEKARRMGRGQPPRLLAVQGPEGPRQSCALGFSTCNSVTQGKTKSILYEETAKDSNRLDFDREEGYDVKIKTK